LVRAGPAAYPEKKKGFETVTNPAAKGNLGRNSGGNDVGGGAYRENGIRRALGQGGETFSK